MSENTSISFMKELRIDNTKQMLMINGNDISNPLLLFLHGGPGASQIGFIRNFQRELEQNFTVVNWDQRGSGLSYTKQIPQSSMTISQIIKDTIQVTEWLLDHFSKTKVYLAGHSWGSLLALHVLQERPDLFHAYYGISQVTNTKLEEKMAYHSVCKTNRFLSLTLGLLGPPPWNKKIHHFIFRVCIELSRGGFTHHRRHILTVLCQLLAGNEYGLKNISRFIRGHRFSSKNLSDDLHRFDAFKSVSSIKVPCFFISGSHDLIVPAEISKQYYRFVDAPEKHWHYFKNSAHTPHIEEPSLFANTLSKHAVYHLK
ncbi:alpha/beta fold hydrolase [Bacillus mojavensis]|uniref:alpha/beta fold hydrolase n=1 Tax=Bacillus mojavensis TaxID=72360 RepID=UPI002DB7AE32|nr:alpha/beta hydrolase [Bacillus mojavensis]MEC1689786.1 alpha/beta hydrolase [Bacillus mojavensis]